MARSIAQVIGAIGGAFWPVWYLLMAIAGVSGTRYAPLWKSFALCLPLIVVGIWAGGAAGDRLACALLRKSRHPFVTFLLSSILGALFGAGTLVIVWELFFISSYTAGIVDFGQSPLGEIVIATLAMAGAVGGTIGLAFGIVFGAFLHLFVRPGKHTIPKPLTTEEP